VAATIAADIAECWDTVQKEGTYYHNHQQGPSQQATQPDTWVEKRATSPPGDWDTARSGDLQEFTPGVHRVRIEVVG